MPKLCAAYSESLAILIRSGECPIDGIEVGPWFSPREIKGFQRELPGWVFHFHASSIVSRLGYHPKSYKHLHEYLSLTQSDWISVHLELLPFYVFWLSSRFGLHLDPPDCELMKTRFIHVFGKINKGYGVPFILENLASLPGEKYAFAADPGMISEILERTGFGLLLDISHARVAASYQKVDIRHYLQRLPLNLVREIHVSGVRMKNGFLRDAHDSMQAEDYEVLGWVLERCAPELVTLEYFQGLEPLRKQLWNLREVIAG
jgi:hypothetical protein